MVRGSKRLLTPRPGPGCTYPKGSPRGRAGAPRHLVGHAADALGEGVLGVVAEVGVHGRFDLGAGRAVEAEAAGGVEVGQGEDGEGAEGGARGAEGGVAGEPGGRPRGDDGAGVEEEHAGVAEGLDVAAADVRGEAEEGGEAELEPRQRVGRA